MLHYGNEEFCDIQPVSNVMNDLRMKTYACMLRRIIWEGCMWLYRRNDLS